MVEAVTGSAPTVLIDDRLVRAVDVSDLALSIRADRSADNCIERLDKIVSNKNIFDHRGPCLEELAGYGAAREFGTNLIADLKLYRAGLLDWGSLSEKGLLLVGPPGTGKTQFFRALSKSLNVPDRHERRIEFGELFVGHTPTNRCFCTGINSRPPFYLSTN